MSNELKIENICLGYESNEQSFFLNTISFSVKSGEVLGILGGTASGKTTLIYLLCGLEKPSRGRVLFNGEDIAGQRQGWKRIRKECALSLEFPEDQFLQKSVSEEFYTALRQEGYTKEEINALGYRALQWGGLSPPRHFWFSRPLQLSLGQLKRLSLAIIRAQNRKIILLDEPTIGLECTTQKRLIADIVNLCHEQKKIGIIASHDSATLLPIVDRSIVLQGGEVIIQGTWDEIMFNEDQFRSSGLSLPPLAELAIKLRNHGIPVKDIWRDSDSANKEIGRLLSLNGSAF